MARIDVRAGRPGGPGSDPVGQALTRQLFLLDTSALGRRRNPAVLRAFERLNDVGRLATCLPLMLEVGFSARSAAEHNEITTELIGRMDLLPLAPEITGIAYDLQRRLFDAGTGRSTGPFDLTVAAHAIHYSNETTEVVVVHYDSDYDHVGRVAPELRAEWIVPRGSIDGSSAAAEQLLEEIKT